MPKGVLVDITKCIGCRSCQVACKQWNELPAENTAFTGGTNPAKITADTWTHIDFHEIVHDDEPPIFRYVKNQCMHCEDPACVAVCPVGALEKTANGPVIYDHDKCIGCRYCMLGCPFGVPAFEWEKQTSLVRKCTFCYDRQEAGLAPACVTACPTGALTYGERDELIAEAERRLAAEPEKYVQHIYGKDEVGGTSWLYISDVPFEEVGFPTDLEKKPLPNFTLPAMQKVPWIAGVGAALYSGLYLYTHRRAQNEAAQQGGANNGDSSSASDNAGKGGRA